MKNIFLITILFFLSTIYSLSLNNWKKKADITVEKASKIYLIDISYDIFKNSYYDLKDIRIIDENKKEIPYKKIIQNEKYYGNYNLKLKIIDFNYENGISKITLHNNKKNKIDKFRILTNSRNFSYLVSLYSSDNKKEWKLILENEKCFDFSSKINYRKTYLKTPIISNEYIKIELKPNNKDYFIKNGNRALMFGNFLILKKASIDNIKFNGFLASFSKNKTNAFFDEKKFDIEIQPKDKNSEIYLNDLNLAIAEINFNIDENNFLRKISVFGSNDIIKKKRWNFISNSSIFSLSISSKEEKKLSVKLNNKFYRNYKIVIENNDNQPLNIKNIKLKWIKQTLAFLKKPKQLLLSNKNIQYPEYDIQKLLPDSIDKLNGVYCKVRKIVSNTDFVEKPLDISKYLIYIIIGILFIVLSLWIRNLVLKMEKDHKLS